MRSESFCALRFVAAIVAPAFAVDRAEAADLTTLVNFSLSTGADPRGGLIADAEGNLIGTTARGGANRCNPFAPQLIQCGNVFMVKKFAWGYASSPTTIVDFNGVDGASPYAGVLADAAGNLFGTTERGGATYNPVNPGYTTGYGTVFEVAKTTSGYAGAPKTLVSFNGENGAYPRGNLIAGANGDLYGTTSAGGTGNGTVFKIAKSGSGYAKTPTTLASFNGANGMGPQAGLLADAQGNFFGTTSGGGAFGYGTLFEIIKTPSGYSPTPVVLVSFNGVNGAAPKGDLIADISGNLFGTTSGGGAFGYGAVFRLTKTASGFASAPNILASFNVTNGSAPHGSLIADSTGNLFGTTEGGGAFGRGTVFKLAKTAGGYANAPTTLVSFKDYGTAGVQPLIEAGSPQAGLLADPQGNLFGTTLRGGTNICIDGPRWGCGTVFKVSNGGYLSPPKFAGTPGSPNCKGKSVSALAKQFGGMNTAAYKLDYTSVASLHDAIRRYCHN